jgi:hypothetical protein
MLRFTRDFYTPKTYSLHFKDETLGAEAYADPTGCVLIMFSGKRQKPDHHIRFASAERAERYLADWTEGLKRTAGRKAEAKQRRRDYRHTYKVGDILKSSWGHEQTNIDYYEITRLIGSHTVELREIAATSEETAFMQGKCSPLPGQYTGEAFTRRVSEGGCVKISSCQYAFHLQPEKMVGNIPVYPASNWTSYA